ncbi:diacylglycerol/lipid kinase family protein [Serinibacter salmoneus]|uniref:Diacylglycerol kinase n=1 Tax=Serinibacter salmoneus TaxID=556530 RepID=A0A2A9CYZ8_9MICO|nr:diacylglycerol kinase family protein [Serinibacter salmoneus]PFG19668.1 diacylglycerol kinase [Serinibacter salmoneus]
MSASTLGVLVNPAAGRGRARHLGPRVIQVLRAAGHEVTDLTAPDPATARALAREFVAQPGPRVLVAVGGDGVANLALNAILVHGPHTALALVAAGTGNDAARGLGQPVRGQEVLDRLVAALARDPRRLDAVLVSPGLTGTSRGRYLLSAAVAGFDAAVAGRTNRIAWPRGTARYVLGVLAELVGFRGYAVRVEVVDGAGQSIDLGLCGTLATVANTAWIGGGMRIAPGADPTDGVLEVVTAVTVPRRTLLRVFPRVFAGTHVEHPVVTVTRGREVVLREDAAARAAGLAPAPHLHGDGEPFGTLPMRLRVVPGAVAVHT